MNNTNKINQTITNLYSQFNDSLPFRLFDTWQDFSRNILFTLDNIINNNIQYSYIFKTVSFNEYTFLPYFFAMLFVLVFVWIYVKPTIYGAVQHLLNILEIFIYLIFIYYFCYFMSNKQSNILYNWLSNFFEINNSLNAIFIIMLLLITLFILASFITVLKSTLTKISSETLILMFLVICFSYSLLEINNYALFLICIEGFSLILYILATTSRTYGGIAASIKYFVFGTLASVLLYWGGILSYEILVTMDINIISAVLENKFDINTNFITLFEEQYTKLILASNLLIVGLLIKIGAAPFHQWIPDVYAGVSIFITTFYATIVKTILFILFIKFALSFITIKEIEYAAFLSLIIGCFGTLRQVELKRFLAYSSITHIGFLLIGDLTATYVYLITYMIASILLFSILLNLRINNKEIVYLTDLRFINSISILDKITLVIILASMAGLPPFAGFYGKMLVWTSLIEDIYLYNDILSFALLLINLLLSLVIIFYYMQIIYIIFINDKKNSNFSYIFSNIKNEYNLIPFIEKFNYSIRLKLFQIFGIILLSLSIFILPYLYNII